MVSGGFGIQNFILTHSIFGSCDDLDLSVFDESAWNARDLFALDAHMNRITRIIEINNFDWPVALAQNQNVAIPNVVSTSRVNASPKSLDD